MRALPATVKARMTPIFTVHPRQVDLETGLPKHSLQDHLGGVMTHLARDWGQVPAFLDLEHLDGDLSSISGLHALEWSLREAAGRGMPLAPCVASGRDTAYRQAAYRSALANSTSLCFRLPPAEWLDLGTPTGNGRLQALLAESGRSPSDIHLVLDARENVTAEPGILTTAFRTALIGLPHSADWASVTVAGTAMPSGTSAIGANNSQEIPRSEWKIWRDLVPAVDHRKPSFGDYGVQHPDPGNGFDPRFMDSSAQLRYTIPGAWFIARGRGMRRAGSAQIRGLAMQVVAHRRFSGRAFSWGDEWLDDCASGVGSTGNQGQWRKVTTNHHLTFVVNQISNLLGP